MRKLFSYIFVFLEGLLLSSVSMLIDKGDFRFSLCDIVEIYNIPNLY